MGLVTEYRQIVFSNQELIHALIEFDRQRAKEFAPGKIVTCAVSDEEPIRATLNFRGSSTDDQRSFEIDASHLAAVLIWSCIERRIPIPKLAKKILRASGSGISLKFRLTDKELESNCGPRPAPAKASATG